MPPNLRKRIKLPRNPYLLFSPFLLFYIIIVIILQTNEFWGDEERYYLLSQHLLHGYYSSPSPYIDFENGPGYPIVISPFVALHLPLVYIKLLNPIFYYLSIVFLFETLKQIVSFRMAFIFCLFWACYYNAYEFMPLLYTETVAIFLITLILFCLTRVFRAGYSKKYIFLSGFILGYLALTKVVFGYVLLVLLIGCGLLWLLNKRRANYKRAVIVLGIAFLTTLPYLIYTYNLTGRIFYWGTSAGINLYWMSSPYQGEYGNWFSDMDFQSDPMPSNKTARYSYEGGQLNLKNRINNTISGIIDSVRLHHQKDFEEINKYKGLERDDAFRRIAFKNIRSHPMKYLINCISNVGRMLFNYPYSYTIQKPGTLLRIPLNGIVVVLALFSLIPTLINWKKVSFSMRFMLFFTFIYLGGSTLESGEFRMFTIIVPVLLVWIAMVIQKSVKINLVFDQTRE